MKSMEFHLSSAVYCNAYALRTSFYLPRPHERSGLYVMAAVDLYLDVVYSSFLVFHEFYMMLTHIPIKHCTYAFSRQLCTLGIIDLLVALLLKSVGASAPEYVHYPPNISLPQLDFRFPRLNLNMVKHANLFMANN
ncbi:hypothetical protein Patl1_25309 [Pistacia atlantica]|uniref:Uncharacterized protein n=1 Tax=Pistacia atlantica TaxID=434234 RepID=A0ACC1B089_9ROSI|nr:hypothetical protein Patl1_25309 [Pistacia atlantica]